MKLISNTGKDYIWLVSSLLHLRLYFIDFQWLGNHRSKRRQNEKIAKKVAKRQKRINKKDSAEEAILNTRIKCIRLTKASRTNKFVLQARKEEELKVNHPLSDEAILKLISDKSFIGCCGTQARCFHNNFINNQLCTEEIDVKTRMLTVKESIKSILLSDSNRFASLVEAQNHLDNHDECFIKEFRHEFKFEDLTLCRYSWAFCMGYSNYELDKCSRILKDNTAVEDLKHLLFVFFCLQSLQNNEVYEWNLHISQNYYILWI